MTSLVQSGVPGLVVPALVDDAKKHPLLILRKLGRMEELLEKDATALSVSLESENRGVIFGRTLGDPACAKVEGNTLKVTMRHWGYNFTENLWISFLEIVTSGTKSSIVIGLRCFKTRPSHTGNRPCRCSPQ
jgi:hypothetical protein